MTSSYAYAPTSRQCCVRQRREQHSCVETVARSATPAEFLSLSGCGPRAPGPHPTGRCRWSNTVDTSRTAVRDPPCSLQRLNGHRLCTVLPPASHEGDVGVSTTLWKRRPVCWHRERADHAEVAVRRVRSRGAQPLAVADVPTATRHGPLPVFPGLAALSWHRGHGARNNWGRGHRRRLRLVLHLNGASAAAGRRLDAGAVGCSRAG